MRNSLLVSPLPWVLLVAPALWVACGGNADVADGDGAGGSGSGTGAASNGTGGFSIGEGGSGSDAGAPGSCVNCMEEESACGDGKITGDEECDDKNSKSGDGCSAQCDAIESGFACPTPGKACVSTIVCGDGKIGGEEQCDDGNTEAGDGCDADCSGTEDGWTCPVAGVHCVAVCGDGEVIDDEQCDTGAMSDPGCIDCKLQRGFKCETPGEPCETTTCGDGVAEGTEQCDDGNNDLGDGCTTLCEREPNCVPPAPCTTECGDGIRLGSEACDDGNTLDGDGCSATCTVEEGYVCSEGAAEVLRLPIVYRDFKDFESGGHVDFQWSDSDPINRTPVQDIWVRTTLGTAGEATPDGKSLEGKPVFRWYVDCDNDSCSDITTGTKPAGTLDASTCNAIEGDATGTRHLDQDGRDDEYCGYGTKDFSTFSQWYRDEPNINVTVPATLRLTQCVDAATTPDYAARCPGGANDAGDFVFDSNTQSDRDEIGSPTGFFPLNGKGFAASTSTADNFHFTSELRYWFKYDASQSAKLTFRGDDDVWVFVNGQLVVDISGTHGATTDSVTIGPDTRSLSPAGAGPKLDLIDGEVYEIVVFQAERNTNASNYRLQLANFSLGTSVCVPDCGDGIVAGDEVCDDEVNDGSYGSCTTDCQLGPRCGDGKVQKGEGEACDDGTNLTPYAKSGQSGCAPGCKAPARCGDGKVDSLFGEQCDDGKNDGGFGQCQPGCKLGNRCGDGTVQAASGEECDDGNTVGGDGCSPSCKEEIIR